MLDAPEKRLGDLARRAARSGQAGFTRFLEPSQVPLARAAAAREGAQLALWGGYPDAERCVAAFFADEPPDAWPVRALRIEWNAKFADPGHRDLLGAVMGLGIERETTGDIVMAEHGGTPCACLFAVEEMAEYIAASLTAAGRAALKVTIADEPPRLLPPEGQSLRLTVQQPRLDAVLAAACRLSRGEAQRLIEAGLVKLNHAPCLRCHEQLREGDLISARGYGRTRIDTFEGESRRGRLALRVFRYGK